MNSERRYKDMEKKHEKKRTWRKNLAVLLVFTLVLTLANAYGTEGVFKGLLGAFEAKAADTSAVDFTQYWLENSLTKVKVNFNSTADYEFTKGATSAPSDNYLTLHTPSTAGSGVGSTELTFGPLGSTTGKTSYNAGVCTVETQIANGMISGIRITANHVGTTTFNMYFKITDDQNKSHYQPTTLTVKVPIIVDESSNPYKIIDNKGYEDKAYSDKSKYLRLNFPGLEQQVKIIGKDYADDKYNYKNSFEWQIDGSPSDNVAAISDNGLATAVGAGITKIDIKPSVSDVDSESLNVLVPLYMSSENPFDDTTNPTQTDKSRWITWNQFRKKNTSSKKADGYDEDHPKAIQITNGDGKHKDCVVPIYSNVKDINDITYKITRKGNTGANSQGQTGQDTYIDLKGEQDKYITYENVNEGVTATSAAITNFTIKKAGLYKIVATIPAHDESGLSAEGKEFFTETFYIKVQDTNNEVWTIDMDEGDIFDPFKMTGIGPANEYSYDGKNANNKDNTIKITEEGGKDVVTVDPKTLKIKAKKSKGAKVTYVFTKKYGYEYTLEVNINVTDSFRIKPSKITLNGGDSADLTADGSVFDVTDTNGDSIVTAGAVTWESESPTVAVVVPSNPATRASITAGSVSTTTTVAITASVDFKGVTKVATAYVTVKPPKTKPTVTISPSSIQLDVGASKNVEAILSPESGLDDSSVEWKIFPETVATFSPIKDSNSTVSVTGVAPGKATLVAININSGVALGSCDITVTQPVESITIKDKGPIIKPQGSTYQLNWTVNPATALQDVTFSSNHPEIATVSDEGVITFVKGTVTPASITITSVGKTADGSPATASIEVVCTTPTAGITLDRSELTLNVGETYNFKINVTPADASDKGFKVSSSDEQVGTISADGTFTALQAGNTVVTVTTSDGKYKATCKVTVKQNSTGIALDASELNLNVGDTYTLKVTFTPATTTETGLIWSSDDDTVATVEDGTVTAVGVGECEVSASTTNGNTARCKVTVYQALGGMSLNETEITVDKGDTFQLEVIFDPDDTTNQEVTWTSSKDGVATVSSDGLVTGVSGGLAIVTATSDDGNYTAQCVVTVMEYAAKLTVKPKSKIMEVGDTLSLTVTASPASVTNKKVTYSSNKKSVATVNKSGVVTAKKVGTATITVKATDGSGATTKCTIKVVKRASSLSLNKYLITMVVGRTTTLKGTVRPKTATVKSLRYKSSDENIVYVTGSGKLTALKTGEATITVSTKDGSGLSKKCKVIVRDYVAATKLSLSATDMTLSIGDKQAVTYSLTPNNTDDKVTWSSNNRRAASVGNNSGIISANSPGQAVITGSTTSGLTATLTVTVVGLSFYTLNMEQYDIYSLSVLGGTTATVSWDTSNASIATVDANGQVTAKKAGRCYIYARVNGALLRCRVTVRNIR